MRSRLQPAWRITKGGAVVVRSSNVRGRIPWRRREPPRCSQQTLAIPCYHPSGWLNLRQNLPLPLLLSLLPVQKSWSMRLPPKNHFNSPSLRILSTTIWIRCLPFWGKWLVLLRFVSSSIFCDCSHNFNVWSTAIPCWLQECIPWLLFLSYHF